MTGTGHEPPLGHAIPISGKQALPIVADWCAAASPAPLSGRCAAFRRVPLSGVEIGIAASALLLGVAVMTERRPPLYVAALLVGFFAIFHGHAHGTELPPGESGLFYSLGFVVATGCLHAVGIAIGTIHRWPAGKVALRVAGGGVGLAGLFFLWQAIG